MSIPKKILTAILALVFLISACCWDSADPRPFVAATIISAIALTRIYFQWERNKGEYE